MAQSTLIQHASISAKPKKVSSFRPDIQGLRAIAVLVVVLDHMFGQPVGGFVGVDVFFVISGFVITAKMLKDHQKDGFISLASFYRHRVRRILPAASLVLLVTVAASWFLFLGERFRSTVWDAIAATLFAANWRFAATGTDYLQAEGPISPLQHYWSLSVEEQFYFVWPALLIGVLTVAASKAQWGPRMARRVLGLAMLAIIGLSLAFAYWETTNSPTFAYFSTISRAWELGIGALIAVMVPFFAKIPATLRPILQWAGFAGIITSVFVINPQTPFPAPGAMLPVLSTALVILGGVASQSYIAPLTNKVSRYIGDISYSLYLWHFPVIILMKAMVPAPGLVDYLTMGVLIVVLSVASYEYVEDPIRNSSWLEPKTRHAKPRRPMAEKKKYIALALLATAAAGMVSLTFIKAPVADPAQVALAPRASASAIPTLDTNTPAGALQAKIGAALRADTWPGLTPSMDDLGSKGFAKEDSEGCAPATPRGKDCSVADINPTKLAIVVGDSMAVAWVPTIKAALEPQGWTVRSMTYVGCPFLEADTKAANEGITAACPAHKELVTSIIREAKPGLVITSNLYNLPLASGVSGDAAVSSWAPAAKVAHQEWLAPASKVVTLSPPPAGKDPKECITRVSTPRDCVSTVSDTWNAYADADRQVTTQAGQAYVDTRTWFCSPASDCPAFADGTIIRRDATHITPEYATKLAPLLMSAMEPALK